MSRIETTTDPTRTRSTRLLLRSVALVGIILLSGVAILEGREVYRHYLAYLAERDELRRNILVGYVDITPHPSYATKPDDWIRDDGDVTLLWAGWRKGRHDWFRMARGDLERDDVIPVLGRDWLRAIDAPIVESGRGERWDRIPDEDPVAFGRIEGVDVAYPLRVLEQVGVVNDLISGLPLLVTYGHHLPRDASVDVYEASLRGKRVTMGYSGYLFGPRPLLYDRGTHSLWAGRDQALSAVAGEHRGVSLRRVTSLRIDSWGGWRSGHPRGRLIVGADRSRGIPDL